MRSRITGQVGYPDPFKVENVWVHSLNAHRPSLPSFHLSMTAQGNWQRIWGHPYVPWHSLKPHPPWCGCSCISYATTYEHRWCRFYNALKTAYPHVNSIPSLPMDRVDLPVVDIRKFGFPDFRCWSIRSGRLLLHVVSIRLLCKTDFP